VKKREDWTLRKRGGNSVNKIQNTGVQGDETDPMRLGRPSGANAPGTTKGLILFAVERGSRVPVPRRGYRRSDLTVKVTLLSQYLGDTPCFDLAWGASEKR
jgi:hypothetical protein